MTAHRLVVIGGGISGLAAAHRLGELAPEAELQLLESDDRIGGVIRTVRRDGYLVEMGPDNFITTKPEAVALIKRLGLEDQLQSTADENRGALVVRNGRLYPVPEGFTMMAPTRIGPILTTPILSWRGKLRLGLEPWVRAGNHGGDESLASFVTRRFGREALERLVEPLVAGIYTADAETLSLEATFPQFLEMERKHGSVVRAMRRTMKKKSTDRGARYSMFKTLRDGMETLPEALERKIGTQRIRTGCGVSRLERGERLWHLILEDGSSMEADGVVVATSTTAAGRLLADVDAALAEALFEISFKSSAVVTMGVGREQVSHPLKAFGFVVPRIEKRRLVACSFSSLKYAGRAPEGSLLLRAFFGGELDEPVVDLDDAALGQLAETELKDLIGLQGQPQWVQVQRYRAMPQFHVGHLGRVEKIERAVAEQPNLVLTGNGYRGMGIPDCIRQAEAAAESLLQHSG
ncbi:MAG: protoporphyrinogen oxidase [Phycisphaeraceae bacterium]|nr:protoporphyrinogen oxidase [Phycisphaeraceae bacterium]